MFKKEPEFTSHIQGEQAALHNSTVELLARHKQAARMRIILFCLFLGAVFALTAVIFPPVAILP